MPFSSNHRREQSSALNLKIDQVVATDEQIRQHLPELFDSAFYLERIREEMTFSSSWGTLKSKLPESFEVYLKSLFDRVESLMAETGFEYDIKRDGSDSDDGELLVAHSCEVAVSLSNVQELLKSAKQPLSDLDALQKLSAFLNHLQCEIGRIEGTLPNFKEHIQCNKIEVQVFKDELSDLLEQEKDGGLTRNEQAQKEELEGKIAGFGKRISKDSSKIKKKKRQIQNNEQKISSAIKILRDFLEQFDSENPSSLPKILKVQHPLGNASSLSSIVKRGLQTKQETEYTVYLPYFEKQMKAARFRRRIRKWVPRAALVLSLTSLVAVVARDQISELIQGPRPAQEVLAMQGVIVPDQALAEELVQNNVELAATKVRLLRVLSQFANERDVKGIVSAKTPHALIDKLLMLLHGKGNINTSFHNETHFKSELRAIVNTLRDEFGDDIRVNLSLIDKTDRKKVMEHFEEQDHQPSITYSVDDACNSNKELYAYLAMTINGEVYSKTHVIPMDHGIKEQACKDVVAESRKAETKVSELAAAKARLKKYIRESLSENLLPLVDKAKNRAELGGVLTQLARGVFYKDYDGTNITFEIDPKYVDLFKIVYGDDVRLFQKKIGEPTMSGRVQSVLKRKFNVAELCENDGKQELEVVYRIGDTDMMTTFSLFTQQADFVSYYCGDTPPESGLDIGLGTKKQAVLLHPFLLKYLTDDFEVPYKEFRQNIEKMNSIQELEDYLSKVVIKLSKSPHIQDRLKLVIDSGPNLRISRAKAKENAQEDGVRLSVHRDFIRALKRELGQRCGVKIGAFIAGQMGFQESSSISMPPNVFCTMAGHPLAQPLIQIDVPITSRNSIKLIIPIKQAVMDHELTREICLGQVNEP